MMQATNTTNRHANPPISDISHQVERLNAALERRKKLTPFITDQQREELKSRYAEILEKPGTAISNEHLAWIQNTSVFLAVAGNFEEFCSTFLERDEKTVTAPLDAHLLQDPEECTDHSAGKPTIVAVNTARSSNQTTVKNNGGASN